jgi:hypothetical protein
MASSAIAYSIGTGRKGTASIILLINFIGTALNHTLKTNPGPGSYKTITNNEFDGRSLSPPKWT